MGGRTKWSPITRLVPRFPRASLCGQLSTATVLEALNSDDPRPPSPSLDDWYTISYPFLFFSALVLLATRKNAIMTFCAVELF